MQQHESDLTRTRDAQATKKLRRPQIEVPAARQPRKANPFSDKRRVVDGPWTPA